MTGSTSFMSVVEDETALGVDVLWLSGVAVVEFFEGGAMKYHVGCNHLKTRVTLRAM